VAKPKTHKPYGVWIDQMIYAVDLGPKPTESPGVTKGGWRRNGRKTQTNTQGDLLGTKHCSAGVRASIVAMKPGNAGGAKGRREMDVE
jgi:hypothetical protein